jgi:hypothetical protein
MRDSEPMMQISSEATSTSTLLETINGSVNSGCEIVLKHYMSIGDTGNIDPFFALTSFLRIYQ